MVYCGRPSKGCSSCRARKILCDLRQPGCQQCQKRDLVCQGYRNLVDLMFRDQNDHVIQRARTFNKMSKTKRRSAAAASAGRTPDEGFGDPDADPEPSPGSSSSTHGIPSSSAVNARLPVVLSDDYRLPCPYEGTWPARPLRAAAMYALSPSYQERGIAFFFAHYVSRDSTPPHQNFHFVWNVWKPVRRRRASTGRPVPSSRRGGALRLYEADRIDQIDQLNQVDAVMAGMTAVGLAALSSLTGSAAMTDWARRSYCMALCLTHAAMRDPATVLSDTTMLSVLILATYEMLTGRTGQAMDSWQMHIAGAVVLAVKRGPAQFRSRAGVQMFQMLCHSARLRAMQRCEPMPADLLQLCAGLDRLIDPAGTNPFSAWAVHAPMYRALELAHQLHVAVAAHDQQACDTIVDRLAAVDDDLAAAATTLPPSSRHRIVPVAVPVPATMAGTDCHVYGRLDHAGLWNDIRSFRLLIHDTILALLPDPVPRRRLALALRSVNQLVRLRAAIVASVPQHFGSVCLRDTAGGQHTHRHNRRLSQLQLQLSATAGSSRQATLCDPTLAGDDADEAARRFMELGSACSTLVWPLFRVATSSGCPAPLRQYVLARLRAIHDDTGMAEAHAVALMVAACGEV